MNRDKWLNREIRGLSISPPGQQVPQTYHAILETTVSNERCISFLIRFAMSVPNTGISTSLKSTEEDFTAKIDESDDCCITKIIKKEKAHTR